MWPEDSKVVDSSSDVVAGVHTHCSQPGLPGRCHGASQDVLDGRREAHGRHREYWLSTVSSQEALMGRLRAAPSESHGQVLRRSVRLQWPGCRKSGAVHVVLAGTLLA